MNRDDDSRSDDALSAMLDELRRALEAGENPPGFDRLLSALTPPEAVEQSAVPGIARQDPEHEAEDDAMLAVLISEALDGVDIARRYPHLFKRMLVDAELRAAFLDGLQALEGTEGAEDEPLPLPPSRDLSFLKRVNRPAARPPAGAGDSLSHRWWRSAADIASLFSFLLPPVADPGRLVEAGGVYRSGGDFLEDETVTLLRGRVAGTNIELDVTLEATRPATQPDELHLVLWIISIEDSAPKTPDLALRANVRWGDYDAQVEITSDGRYPLPPRKLQDILDEAQSVADDLHITLQRRR